MKDQFNNKYRIPSARLQTWSYGWNAAYFITICTKDRECFFGNIENGIMNLSGAGIIADILWYEIKNHATDTELGEFVVMPNHIHGIIILNRNDNANTGITANVETGHALFMPQITIKSGNIKSDNTNNAAGATDNAETGHALSLQHDQIPLQLPVTPGSQRFQNQGKNTFHQL